MKRALLLFALSVGCAAPRAERAAPATAAPAPPPSTTSTDSDGAPDTAGAVPGAEVPTSKAPPSVAPVPGAGGTAVMPGEIGKAQIGFDDASKAFNAAGSDCAQLCKALGSMTNATDHLCELTQGGTLSDQQRCSDARARLDFAKAKVKSSCGTC